MCPTRRPRGPNLIAVSQLCDTGEHRSYELLADVAASASSASSSLSTRKTPKRAPDTLAHLRAPRAAKTTKRLALSFSTVLSYLDCIICCPGHPRSLRQSRYPAPSQVYGVRISTTMS